jgi:transcriptional regulator with XRE-family HTH domain
MDEGLDERLRRMREAAGMSLTELAKATKISVSMLSRLESGDRGNLTVHRAVAICDVLGISLDEFAGRTTVKPDRRRRAALARARKLADQLQATLKEID